MGPCGNLAGLQQGFQKSVAVWLKAVLGSNPLTARTAVVSKLFYFTTSAVVCCNLLHHWFLFWLWVAATVIVVSERLLYHWFLKLDHCCYAEDYKLTLSSRGDLVLGWTI